MCVGYRLAEAEVLSLCWLGVGVGLASTSKVLSLLVSRVRGRVRVLSLFWLELGLGLAL